MDLNDELSEDSDLVKKLVEKDFALSSAKFRKDYPNYDIVLCTPFSLIGQNISNPRDFVVMGIPPRHGHLPRDFVLYVTGFASGVLDDLGYNKSLGNGDHDYYYNYGRINGEAFRKFMIELKTSKYSK